MNLSEPAGWIGVDFDGTLAEYHGWVGWNVFGKPIPIMTERVKQWLAEEKDVRIFTARIGLPLAPNLFPHKYSIVRCHQCKDTGQYYSDSMMNEAIGAYCLEHVGKRLLVQSFKDCYTNEFWDDRAIQVIPNTGLSLAEEHEAQWFAHRSKVFKPEGAVSGRFMRDDPFIKKSS